MEKKWWQSEVVYQIYPKSFCDSNDDGTGDIPGIMSRLDYLKELGVTMLWICPVFRSPMDDNGYDISDYFDLAPEFGTLEDLRELVRAAKEIGIKIILDLVINHTSDEHEWFQRALKDPDSKWHDFYIFKEGKERPNNWRSVFGGSVWEKVSGRDEYYFHAFGTKQPDLNWENPEVRETLYGMVNQWLELGIAGFRIDAITFIKKDLTFRNLETDGADGLAKCTKGSRNQPGIGEFLRELKEKTFQKHDCVTVAEAPGVGYDELEDFIGENGYFSMIFDFKHADLDVAGGSEWFRRVPWTIADLNERLMRSQMAIQKAGWSANFIENHDQPRATTKYLLEAAGNAKAVKTLGAMYFFLRGTPFIYQGQELGMQNFVRDSIDEFNDISSTDQYYRAMEEGCTKEEALHYINLRSRDNARTPFPWTAGENAGFSSVKPWLKVTGDQDRTNAEKQRNDPESIFHFYRHIIALRQDSAFSECLIYGDIQPLETACGDIIAYKRSTEEMSIVCYFNFSREAQEEILPSQIREIVLNTEETLDVRTNAGCDANDKGIQEKERIVLAPFQTLMYRSSCTDMKME